MTTKNHPGVYVPPPLIYVAFFFLSFILQKWRPLDQAMLNTTTAHIVGWLFITLFFIICVLSMHKFIRSKNTVITVKPATSLQTTGIYAFTRNPMYISLLLLYCGLAVFKGNWWTFILLPLLILVVQLYVIRKEETYLYDAFGKSYLDYRKKVRRWI